jgi:hypothetical protein
LIQETDRALCDWVGSVLPKSKGKVLLEPSTDGQPADVLLRLIELADMPPARGTRRPPLQVLLRYLVTVGGADASEMHGRLGDLLFAAMEHPDYEVELGSVAPSAWAALGTAMQPSFVLAVPVRKPVPEAPAKLVKGPLDVRGSIVSHLDGVVLGPGDVPVPDAFIEFPALGLAERSDTRGRFRFAAVPSGPGPYQLRVRAKAGEFPFSVDNADRDEPVELRLDLAKG